MVRKIKELFYKKYCIKEENIVLSASHTHGSPNPDKSISYPNFSEKFDTYLFNIIIKCFSRAFKKKKIMVLTKFKRFSENTFSVNRRKKGLVFKDKINYKMQSLPNFKKKIDNNIDLIDFTNTKNNKIEVALVRLACHPVSSPSAVKGPDFVGYLKQGLKNRAKSILFLQGFCGDIRPKIIKTEKSLKDFIIKALIGKRFRNANKKDALLIGNKISDTILNFKNESYDINFCNIEKSRKILHKMKLSDNSYHEKKLKIILWNWGSIVFLFINAEVLSGFNLLNYKEKKVLCVGYSNGMIGYLPTKKDILEGGYEIEKSRSIFKIKKNLSTDEEKKIKEKINNIFSKMYKI